MRQFRIFTSLIMMILSSNSLFAVNEVIDEADDRIYYTISDLTEYNIYNYIKEHYVERKDDICIFVGITSMNDKEPVYILLLVPDSLNDYTSYLKKSTNRYIIINKDSYPVIFDLDFIFADKSINSQYIKYQPLIDGEGYEFSFPGESKEFEDISMWGVDISGYTIDD